MPKNMPNNPPNPEELVGEILDRRYALLESQGPWRQGHRYLAFDMAEMVQVQVLMLQEAEDKPRYLVLTPTTPPPLPPPPAAKRPDPARLAPPTVRKRLDTGRLVAAWFARGEQLEQEEVDEEALESPEETERLARELPEEAFRKFAL